MDLKTLFGLTVIPAAALGGIVLASLLKPVRDLFFVLLVFLCPLVERLDLNYVSREWYRGTSRGFEVAVLDILSLSLLASTVLFPRRGQLRAFWPASLALMLLLFLYAGFNVAIADPRLFGMFEWARMMRGFILVLAVAFFVQSERELKLFLFALAASICYESLLGVKQRYFEGVHRVFGTLDESNSLSGFLCTTTPVLVAAFNSRLPKLLKWFCVGVIPLAAVAEILTISRAGVVILSFVLLGTVLSTARLRVNARTISWALVLCLGAGGLAAKSWKTLSSRFGESTLKEEYQNKKNLGRGYYIRIALAIAQERFFGVGLNNWSYWVSNVYGPRQGYPFVPYKGTDMEPSDKIPEKSILDEAQAAPAHSLGALTLGELGIPGLVLVALVWLRWFQMGSSFLRPKDPDPLRRIPVGILFGFGGMFLQCLTEWFFRHLPLYYVFHVMLGVLMGLHFLRSRAVAGSVGEVEWTDSASPPRPVFVQSWI
jgi:hypothetical protein